MVASSALSLMGQSKSRSEAKKADRENRKTAAWNALMQAAAGATPQNNYQAQPAPQVDWGGAVGQIAGAVGAYQGYQDNKQREARQDKLESEMMTLRERQVANQEQSTTNAENRYQQQRFDDNIDQWAASAQARADASGREVQGMLNPGISDDQKWLDEQALRRERLQIEREKMAAGAPGEKRPSGSMSEKDLVAIYSGRKEDDLMSQIIAKQNGVKPSSGYKYSGAERLKARRRLMDEYGWKDDELEDPLGSR
jgi:hypothetical protein